MLSLSAIVAENNLKQESNNTKDIKLIFVQKNVAIMQREVNSIQREKPSCMSVFALYVTRFLLNPRTQDFNAKLVLLNVGISCGEKQITNT